MNSRLVLLVLPLLLVACQSSPGTSTPDQAAQAAYEVVRLEYAYAAEVARSLNVLIDPASESGTAPSIKIVPDERTNSLLLKAPPEDLIRLKDMIARLDVER